MDAKQNHNPNILVLFRLIFLPHSFPTFLVWDSSDNNSPKFTIISSFCSFSSTSHVMFIGYWEVCYHVSSTFLIVGLCGVTQGFWLGKLDSRWVAGQNQHVCGALCWETQYDQNCSMSIFFLIFICGVSNREKYDPESDDKNSNNWLRGFRMWSFVQHTKHN